VSLQLFLSQRFHLRLSDRIGRIRQGKEDYKTKPARLRMGWMARPKTSKVTYELMSIAIAALEGCEVCVKNHEASVLQHGLTSDHVHDAVRIAAILQGSAVALHLE